ncbi:MAG: magnesium transporter [Anaerolineales bacterium]
MAYLSELLGRKVTDIDGEVVGRLKDIIAIIRPNLIHPQIEALFVQTSQTTIKIPFSLVAVLIAPAIVLKCRSEDITPYEPEEREIYLACDVLDQQIIDIEGARVVRVNDVELVRVNGNILVSNVDIGLPGILRRLGVGNMAFNILRKLKIPFTQRSVAWDYVELIGQEHGMRLRVPGKKITELHPADIAEIIADLNRLESRHLLESLDVEHLADTLEEVEPEFQASLLEGMPDEKVADVLEEMEPDEAADLLAELPKERSADLLALMEKDEAEDVRKLLSYPEDSAGGIMTTEFASVPASVTAAEAIQILRQTEPEAETIFYVYVVDEQNHLLGVFSLSKLLFADPSMPVSQFMQTRIITVSPSHSQEEVAQIVAKYDLLAIPVVDDQNILQGIVTADDALDKIIPTAWKKRLPRFYH